MMTQTGPKAYTYKAAHWCVECAKEVMDEIECPGDPDDYYSFDSEDYPKAIVGSFEADSPCHCAECGKFLENELTEHGRNYVYRSALEDIAANGELSDTVEEWVDYYDYISIGEPANPVSYEKVRLTEPFECPFCAGHMTVDWSYLEQAECTIQCPYCTEELLILPETREESA